MADPITVVLGPSEVNLDGIRAGDRNQIMVTIKQDGVPANITGWVFSAQARVEASDPAASLTATCVITSAAAGQLTVSWPGDAVYALLTTRGEETFNGIWDLQAVIPGGVVTLVQGTFVAHLDVTRSS